DSAKDWMVRLIGNESNQLGGVAKRRTAEHRDSFFRCQLDDLTCVDRAAGEWLIDIAGKACLQKRSGSVVVNAALLRLNQPSVDLVDHILGPAHKRNAKLFDLPAIPRDSFRHDARLSRASYDNPRAVNPLLFLDALVI